MTEDEELNAIGKSMQSTDKAKDDLENPYKTSKRPDPYIRNSFIMLGVGIQLFVTVIVFIYIGMYFDTKMETTNFLSLIGGIIGILVGLFNFFKLVKRFGVGGTEYDD